MKGMGNIIIASLRNKLCMTIRNAEPKRNGTNDGEHKCHLDNIVELV